MAPSDLAQDPNEPFDVLDEAGAPTGEVKARHAVHRDGDWHRALHIWIVGVDAPGEAFLLLQRRGLGKDTHPGLLDVSVGGHYRAGESFAEALREAEEEIGIAPDTARLQSLGRRRVTNIDPPRGVTDREIQDVYLLRDDRALTDYAPNPAELAALLRVPIVGLVAMLDGVVPAAGATSLDAPTRSVSEVTIGAGDIVVTATPYLARVAVVAGRSVRGERPFTGEMWSRTIPDGSPGDP